METNSLLYRLSVPPNSLIPKPLTPQKSPPAPGLPLRSPLRASKSSGINGEDSIPPSVQLTNPSSSVLDLESNAPSIPPRPRRRCAFLIPGFHNPPPFLVFLRRNWYDILTQLLCVLAAFLLYKFCPPLIPRYFPLYPGIERSSWGLKYGQPYIKEYITTIVSAVTSFAVPAAIMGAIVLWGTRNFEDGNAALIGLGYALSTATLFQCFIKIFIGGLRPHFLTICAPTMPPSAPGSNVRYYTASQVCTGKPSAVKEAQMSFPSGHACAAFAGFGFLALWLNAKFKVLSRGGHFRDHYGANRDKFGGQKRTGRRVHHWKLLLFMTPWSIAIVLAASKVRDMWHHPIDVVFGALLGTLFAHLAYKMAYQSIYDWRTNHIPLGLAEEEQGGEQKAG